MANVFWPYGRRVALLATLAIWTAAAVGLGAASAAAGWPDRGTESWLPFVVLALGLLPPALVLLDGFRSSRARIDLPWFKVDFSATVVGSAVIRESAGIPENIVAPGEPVFDSGGPRIEAALARARESRILVVDLREGEAWWVTRLLVLAAGAVRSRTTEAIVFVGTREETEGRVFLGWATPEAVVRALLRARPEYRQAYERAERIERQVGVFGGAAPAGVVLDPRVGEFGGSPKLEWILLRLLGNPYPDDPQLENPPDRLTEARLEELLSPCIHRRDVVDPAAPGSAQIQALLAGGAPFVAIVRDGRFEGLLRRSDGERLILKRLLDGREDAPAPAGAAAAT